MSVHEVKITDDLKIQFTCHSDQHAECRNYPDCQCESWDDDHEHPKVPQPECWMQAWFDNDGIDPMSENLEDCEYRPGMSGPIKTYFCEEYIEWEFAS